MKRTLIIALCLLAAAWASPASADSKTDQAQQAQINVLTAQVSTLNSQVNALTAALSAQNSTFGSQINGLDRRSLG